jgi:hypothetical protein
MEEPHSIYLNQVRWIPTIPGLTAKRNQGTEPNCSTEFHSNSSKLMARREWLDSSMLANLTEGQEFILARRRRHQRRRRNRWLWMAR